MIISELEYKDHGFKKGQILECGCSVWDVIDKDNVQVRLCNIHRQEINLALKQSIISKSKA